MVGIIIDYDLVAIPNPIIDESIIVGRHGKEKAAETKSLRATARQPPHMGWPNATTEVAVLPRMIEVVMEVVPSRVVANPGVVIVDVGCIWMTLHIAVIARLRRLFVLHWRAMSLRLLSNRLVLRGRRRPMRGNMASPCRMTRFRMLLCSERTCGHQKQRSHSEHCDASDLFHSGLQGNQSNCETNGGEPGTRNSISVRNSAT